eukprot:2972299-Amphidinium_carterae.1
MSLFPKVSASRLTRQTPTKKGSKAKQNIQTLLVVSSPGLSHRLLLVPDSFKNVNDSKTPHLFKDKNKMM